MVSSKQDIMFTVHTSIHTLLYSSNCLQPQYKASITSVLVTSFSLKNCLTIPCDTQVPAKHKSTTQSLEVRGNCLHRATDVNAGLKDMGHHKCQAPICSTLQHTLRIPSPFSVVCLRCFSAGKLSHHALKAGASSFNHASLARFSSQNLRQMLSTLVRYTRTSSRRYWGSKHRNGRPGLSLRDHNLRVSSCVQTQTTLATYQQGMLSNFAGYTVRCAKITDL